MPRVALLRDRPNGAPPSPDAGTIFRHSAWLMTNLCNMMLCRFKGSTTRRRHGLESVMILFHAFVPSIYGLCSMKPIFFLTKEALVPMVARAKLDAESLR